MFQRTKLPDGPRVITARLPSSRSVSMAAYVLAGSRLETADEAGVAHFMEHLTFKGTAGYPSSRAISEAVEGVGGSANAATDRESTVYWARVPRREAATAMHVLGELIVHPRLEDADIDQERTVIIEEIRSYLDDPSEYSQMLIQQALFGDGPLGREICGDEAGIRAPADVRDPRLLAVGVPAVEHGRRGRRRHRARRGGRAGGGGLRDRRRRAARVRAGAGLPAGPRYLSGKRDTAQAQLAIAVPALKRDHPDAWALSVLNVVLGDGMSSRLFLGVREEKGLAYDVSSGIVEYADAGALEISAGVDPVQLPAAIGAILEEVGRMIDEPVGEVELAKAKAYLAGGLELRMDDSRHLASWIGGQEALHDRVYTLDEALEAVEAVRPEAITKLAGELFTDDVLRMAVVAPARHLRGLEKHLKLPR